MNYALLSLGLLFPTAIPTAQAENSIRDLPELAQLLTHHYECRLAISYNDDLKEVLFQFSPNLSGHGGQEVTLELQGNQVAAAANNQMLQVTWTRAGKGVASSLTMIQSSPTRAYVLMVNDPANDSNRVDLNCNAVQFSELKGNQK